MKKSTQTKIELFIVFSLIIGFLIFKYIPEYKKSQGSSDKYFDISSIDNIVEIKINDNPNFALATSKNIIIGIFFFDKESISLYNQNIENTTIDNGIKRIVAILTENDYLKNSYTISFNQYINTQSKEVENAFKNAILNLNLSVIYVENTITLEEKALSLDITETEPEQIISQLELYSKNNIRHYKNDISDNDNNIIVDENITEESSKTYADNVYNKLQKYVSENNIVNQDALDTTLPIILIPASQSGKIFSDNTSWYYVKDGKIYAYISFTSNNESYSYCYEGTIDKCKKGQC